MDVTLVIVNYNSTQLLEQLAASIPDACGLLAYEVCVVDNASRVFDAEGFRRRHPEYRLIANTENLGFAYACNQGIREARGRHVALVNPDVILKPDCLAVLVRYLDTHADTAVVGPQLLNADGSVQSSCRRIPTVFDIFFESSGLARLFPRHPVLGGYRMTYWAHDDERAVEQVMGAVFGVRRAVLDEVGAFDERFFMYYEEVDLCRRIAARGYRIVFTPAAQAIHFMGESAATDKTNALVGFYRSRAQFFRKHEGRLSANFVYFISLADVLLRSTYWTWRAWRRPQDEKIRMMAISYRRTTAALCRPALQGTARP